MPARWATGITLAYLLTCAGARTSYCQMVLISQVGKAGWYDLVGKPTASGEILDTVRATAAHRSLPLISYARVTNLGNDRSVIVKINDRGPYTMGRILDLSPRAAEMLDMKRAGVASVVIEPFRTPNEGNCNASRPARRCVGYPGPGDRTMAQKGAVRKLRVLRNRSGR